MKWILYRAIMRFAHRFNWHYAPPINPNGDTVLRCDWCGMTYVKERRKRMLAISGFGCDAARGK